jgi:hypothetical protein
MAYDTSKPKGDMDLIGGGGGSGTSTQYGSQFKAESGEIKTDLIAVGAIILGIVVLLIGVKVFIRMMRKPVEKGKKKDAKELKDTPPDADPMDFEAYDGDEPPWEEEQFEEQPYRIESLDDPTIHDEVERIAKEEIEAKYWDLLVDQARNPEQYEYSNLEDRIESEIKQRAEEIFEELLEDYFERHPEDLIGGK